ncbi:MAG: magnesium/cobalt transporter CorA [Chitinispirillaceae bacterium]|nr:magnesium/cobalt transporter CorA [Chitinispirillaceae bacterium]
MKLTSRIHPKKSGLPPGSIVPIEMPKKEPVALWSFEFNENSCSESHPDDIDFAALKKATTISWLNIDGLSDAHLFERIGTELGIHNLTLEDIMTIDQFPKVEDHERYFYIVLKMIFWDDTENDLEAEQVSLLLLHDIVISIQEKPGDVFNPVRERLRRGVGRTRKEPADYLVYSLMDAIVDNYFNAMDRLGEEIEKMEDEVLEQPIPATSFKIHKLRTKVTMLRRSIWLLRDVVSTMLRSESDLIRPNINPYIRDLYDHTIKVIETLEIFRDTLSGLLDIYLSSVSNKMNEIMKVLTMISTVFIPLGFLAGIYGMNFKYMPELDQWWGYPALLGVMVLFVVAFLLFFKKKKWW